MDENQSLDVEDGCTVERVELGQDDFAKEPTVLAQRAQRILQRASHVRKLTLRLRANEMASLTSCLELREGAKLQVTELHLECLCPGGMQERLNFDARQIILHVTGVTTLTVIDITSDDLKAIEDMPSLTYLTIYYFKLAERHGCSDGRAIAFPVGEDSPVARARLQRLVLGRYCPTHVLRGLLGRHQETLQMLICSDTTIEAMQAVSRCLLLREVAVGPGPHLHLLGALRQLWRLTLDLNGLEDPFTSFSPSFVAPSVTRSEALQQAAPHLAGLRSVTELYFRCSRECNPPRECPCSVLELTIRGLRNCKVRVCWKTFPGL